MTYCNPGSRAADLVPPKEETIHLQYYSSINLTLLLCCQEIIAINLIFDHKCNYRYDHLDHLHLTSYCEGYFEGLFSHPLSFI